MSCAAVAVRFWKFNRGRRLMGVPQASNRGRVPLFRALIFTAEDVFWVPLSGRWDRIQTAAKQPDTGKCIDDAMTDRHR